MLPKFPSWGVKFAQLSSLSLTTPPWLPAKPSTTLDQRTTNHECALRYSVHESNARSTDHGKPIKKPELS